jgi:hypothetical protein
MAPSPWKVAYRAAALEPDDALLEKRISTARALMTSRLIELISAQKNIGEIRAIQKALKTLVAIKWERLGRAA